MAICARWWKCIRYVRGLPDVGDEASSLGMSCPAWRPRQMRLAAFVRHTVGTSRLRHMRDRATR